MSKVTELSARAAEIIGVERHIAVEALTEMMEEAFERLGTLMVTAEKESTEMLEFDGGICGLPKELLEDIYTWSLAGNLPHWLASRSEAERESMTLAFLNLDGARRAEWRARFPNAFRKWQDEEDSLLLDQYRRGANWKELSTLFGRNVNAIKLRLGKLGIDLGADAGVRRFTAKSSHTELSAV